MVNAFWLDRDPAQAARWLVDKHVLSSVLECSLVLTTAAELRGYGGDLPSTHEHHPLTVWAADSFENWRTLHEYTRQAHEEWRYRWDHTDEEVHGSWAAIRALDVDRVRALDWPGEAADPPQCTGDWTADDVIDAYRLYVANEKRHLHAWKKRGEPPWLAEYTLLEGMDHPY